MQCNIIISLRNEVIEQEISQKWSLINFMKNEKKFKSHSFYGFFHYLEKISKEPVWPHVPTQNSIKRY